MGLWRLTDVWRRANGSRENGGEGMALRLSPPPPKGDSPTCEGEPDMKVASKDAELGVGASPENEGMRELVGMRSHTTRSV